jgi:hypothetical protein
MALDAVATRYANTLFRTRSEELQKQYIRHRAEVIADLASRNIHAHNAGQYHVRLTHVGISHVQDLAEARVDTLLEAYRRAKLPIDNETVTHILREASDYADAQGKFLAGVIAEQVGRSLSNPAGVSQQLTGTIDRAVSGIKSRINFRLLALRDGAILDARSAAPAEVPPPPTPPPAPAPPPETKTPPIVAPPKSSIGVDIRKRIRHIWDASARWDWLTLAFVIGAVLVGVGEYAFGIFFIVLAAFAATSKCVHETSVGKTLKVVWMVGIMAALGFAIFVVDSFRGQQPWSHAQEPARLFLHRNDPLQIIDVEGFLRHKFGLPKVPDFALLKTPEMTTTTAMVKADPSEPIPSKPQHHSGEGFMSIEVTATDPNKVIDLGSPINFTVIATNVGHEAVTDMFMFSAFLPIGEINPVHHEIIPDAKVVAEFRDLRIASITKQKRLVHENVIVAPGQQHLATVGTHDVAVTKTVVDSFYANRTKFYVLAWVEWKTMDGLTETNEQCGWLDPPKPPTPNPTKLIWHDCDSP